MNVITVITRTKGHHYIIIKKHFPIIAQSGRVLQIIVIGNWVRFQLTARGFLDAPATNSYACFDEFRLHLKQTIRFLRISSTDR